jgi:hypothetical protein
VNIAEEVYAELAAHFAQPSDLDRFPADTGIRLERAGIEALARAGWAWHLYRQRRPGNPVCPSCGAAAGVRCVRCQQPIRPRQHVVSDFFGAHALVHAQRLLTSDWRYYSTYFPELKLE